MKQKFFSQRKSTISKILILAVALFSVNHGFSQKVTPGARVGTHFSNFKISGASDVEPLYLSGSNAGIFSTLHISKSFSIEPEVSISYQGSQLKYSNDEKVPTKLAYLQVPVVARYEFKNRLAFFAGPEVAFLLKATTGEESGEKQNVKPAFKRKDFSVVGGAEYYFKSGIGIRANYTAGFTDIYKQASEKITNYSFGLSVAYRFTAKKNRMADEK
ncbi:MAG TPA: porin family protein [Agriterribacter sp.]|nr:porin family protein [Agriterribacter sp.]HRQ49020.1 porin family protein [Agriterribacter sp.]